MTECQAYETGPCVSLLADTPAMAHEHHCDKPRDGIRSNRCCGCALCGSQAAVVAHYQTATAVCRSWVTRERGARGAANDGAPALPCRRPGAYRAPSRYPQDSADPAD